MAMDEDRLTLLSLNVEKTTRHIAEQAKQSYYQLHDYLFKEQNNAVHGSHLLIVGGGIIGLMLAYYAVQHGQQVTVVERKSFGAAASGRNGGGILALGRELDEIPFVRLSMDLWESLLSDGIHTWYLRSGHAMVARNGLEAEKLAKAQELYQLAGLELEYLDSRETTRLLPDLNPTNHGALFSPVDAQSYPFTSMFSMMERLKQVGVSFYSHCEVTGFRRKNNEIVSVQTNLGEMEADIFVLCTGPWTEGAGKLLDVHLPIIPRRSQIMVTEMLESRRIHPFVSGNGLYLRQTHAGNVLYGGGGSWEQTSFQVTNSMQAIHLLSERLLELFPSYETRQLIRAFAGTVEITPDHLPLFGALANYENVYVSAGYNGHGFGMSAVMGKLLAKLIASHHDHHVPDEINSLIQRFNPSRFVDMNSSEAI